MNAKINDLLKVVCSKTVPLYTMYFNLKWILKLLFTKTNENRFFEELMIGNQFNKVQGTEDYSSIVTFAISRLKPEIILPKESFKNRVKKVDIPGSSVLSLTFINHVFSNWH